jgi:membrane protease YdiL (CAAX protease family)
MYENDPLWRLRHAIVGAGLALLVSVFIAALLGAALAPLIADTYGVRSTIYGVLLVYVIVGTALVFKTVARSEQQALSAQRFLLWLISLWLWPLLLLRRK